MEKLAPGTRWKWLGFLTVFTPLIILSYYSVVGGWSIEYFLKSLTLSFSDPAVSMEEHSAVFGVPVLLRESSAELSYRVSELLARNHGAKVVGLKDLFLVVGVNAALVSAQEPCS